MPTTLESEVMLEIFKHGLQGDEVVDGLSLTEGNPGAQSVYLQALQTRPTRAAEAFTILRKHNLFSFKIWLIFKHRYHEQIEPFLDAVFQEDPQTVQLWQEFTTSYAVSRGLSNTPLPFNYYEGPPNND